MTMEITIDICGEGDRILHLYGVCIFISYRIYSIYIHIIIYIYIYMLSLVLLILCHVARVLPMQLGSIFWLDNWGHSGMTRLFSKISMEDSQTSWLIISLQKMPFLVSWSYWIYWVGRTSQQISQWYPPIVVVNPICWPIMVGCSPHHK